MRANALLALGTPLWWDLATHVQQGISGLSKGSLRRILQTDGPPVAREELLGSVVTIDGISLFIDDRLSETSIRRIVSGVHTHQERRLVLSVLRPDDVVMELGAGIGMVSIACAKVVGSDRVFAFEANPQLADLIEHNCRINGVAPRIEMCLLGREEGAATFNIARDFGSSSLYAGAGTTSVTVPIHPLNDAIDRIKPTVLVMDVEGAEQELVSFIRLDGVRELMLETHPHIYGARRSNSVRRTIRRMGFAERSLDGKHCLFSRVTAINSRLNGDAA